MNNANSPRSLTVPRPALAPFPISATRLVSTAPASPRSVPPPLPSPPPPAPFVPRASQSEEVRRTVKADVEDAVAPLSREIRTVRARLEELEGRPRSTPPVAPSSPPAALIVGGEATVHAAANESLRPHPQVISIEEELRMVDGGRRRRRTVGALAGVLFLVVGSLLGAMAWSYI
jgi:hypothetical protein